ncbi:uncharacterized protein LOC134776542 [Penaeus indicus]|uniref:uncharacterized protein LOC134776542 n=1 Tax=Penaeus indicus TaxID=29960 RepID=UPI00300D461C
METEKLHQIGRDLGLTGVELAQFIKEGMQRKFETAKIEAELKKEELKIRQLELKKEFPVVDEVAHHDTAKVQVKYPKLPVFNDKCDNIDAYLQRFERFARNADWSEEVWAISLASLLQGKALDIYHQLTPSEANNFELVKSALLKGFDCTAEGFRTKFRNCKFSTGETAKQLISRMTKLFERWTEMAECEKEYEVLKELIIREQFLSSCDRNLSLFLKERSLRTLQELQENADRFLEAHGNQGTRAMTHQSQVFRPPQPSTPSIPATEKGAVRGQVTCFICNKRGHRAWECYFRPPNVRGKTSKPQPRKEDAAAPVSSVVVAPETSVKWNRGEAKESERKAVDGEELCGGTLAKGKEKLKTARGEVEGRKAVVLRDTGCSTVLVRRSLVPSSKLTGKEVGIMMANSKIYYYPEAVIDVKTPYCTGRVNAVCLPQPLYDLIIGEIPGASTGEDDARTEKCGVMTRMQTRFESECKRKTPVLKIAEVTKMLNTNIQKTQEEDKSLDGIRIYVQKGKVFERMKNNEISKFVLKRGLLYRHVKTGKRQRDQLIVPQACRQAILELAHSGIMGGHLGTSKTKDRILAHFFWPGVTVAVTRYCRSCDVCQRTVDKGKVSKVRLGDMPLIGEPFSRMAVDLVGPLEPRSSNGSRYILTAVDYAMRYPEAVALPSIDTPTVAEALVTIFSRVGVPREILSDRGTQFTSDIMKEVYRLLSIQSLTTTPYHAMCNGLVEKFNGTLKKMLKRMCIEQPKEWHRYLAPLLFAYRQVPQASTGFSPFELIYGHTVRGPLTLLRELWDGSPVDDEVKSAYEYVINLRERLENTCRMALTELKQAQEVAQHYYDQKTKDRNIVVGDDVLLLLPTNTNKLLFQWKGPFRVLGSPSKWNKVVDVNGTPRKYHVNMLKRYVYREGEKKTEKTAVAVVASDAVQGKLITIPSYHQQETWKDVHCNIHLPDDQQEDLKEILRKYETVLTDVPGKTNVTEYKIEVTVPDTIRVKPYPIPYSLEDVVREELSHMMQLGIIEASDSSFSTPILVVPKKDGNHRLCLDFRRLNKIVKFDAEPMCDPESIFCRLSHRRYFSKIDLTKGYWQIPLEKDSRKFTAFSTPAGLFQFTVLPFGLVNAPAAFNRLMRSLFGNMEGVETFLDDILVHATTWDQHCILLEQVLTKLCNANLTARPTKCELGKTTLEYLGHIVGEGQLKPTVEKTINIIDTPPPTSKKQVRSFLGLSGYYRRYIENYASIAAPLTELVKKSAPSKVTWREEHQRAFDRLKYALSDKPILKLPDINNPFILRTDASEVGLGAVLLQEDADEKLPVAYASRKLSNTEQKYSVIERECLAVVWATKKFYKFLYGREFYLETDHQPLVYLDTAKSLNGRLMRWALALQEYRMIIRYIRGSENVGADFLSRNPVLSVQSETVLC